MCVLVEMPYVCACGGMCACGGAICVCLWRCHMCVLVEMPYVCVLDGMCSGVEVPYVQHVLVEVPYVCVRNAWAAYLQACVFFSS